MRQHEMQRIIDSVPSNLTEIEIARYVYLELGKLFEFDTNYSFSKSSCEQSSLFYNHYSNALFQKDFSVICSSAAKILAYILKELNLDATICGYTDYKHLNVILKTKDNKKYLLDLSQDLSRISGGFRTNNFANNVCENSHPWILELKDIGLSYLSQEDLKLIDDKLHYTFHGLYTDDFIDAIAIEMKNEEALKQYVFSSNLSLDDSKTKAKVDFLLHNAKLFKEKNLHLSTNEISYYYNLILRSCLLPNEQKALSYNSFLTNNTSKSKSVMDCIRLKLNSNTFYYLFSLEHFEFIEISGENLLKEFKHNSLLPASPNAFNKDDFFQLLD